MAWEAQVRDPRSAGRSRSPEATRAALRSGGRDSRRGPLAPAFPSRKATLQTQKRWKRSRCRAPSVLAAAVALDGPGRARGRRGTVCRGRVAAGQRSRQPRPSALVICHESRCQSGFTESPSPNLFPPPSLPPSRSPRPLPRCRPRQSATGICPIW